MLKKLKLEDLILSYPFTTFWFTEWKSRKSWFNTIFSYFKLNKSESLCVSSTVYEAEADLHLSWGLSALDWGWLPLCPPQPTNIPSSCFQFMIGHQVIDELSSLEQDQSRTHHEICLIQHWSNVPSPSLFFDTVLKSNAVQISKSLLLLSVDFYQVHKH